MTHEERFKAWFASLPKHIREEAETLGAGLSTIKDPPIGGMREIDEAALDSDAPHAGATEVYRAIQEISKQRLTEEQDPQADDRDREFIATAIRLLHFFLEAADAHQPGDLAATHSMVMKIVFGIGDPPPQREIARKYGIPKSTINKRVKQMQDRLGLEPSQFMHHSGHCRAFSLGHTLAQIKRKCLDQPESRSK